MDHPLHPLSPSAVNDADPLADLALRIALSEDQRLRAERTRRAQRHVDRAARWCTFGLRGLGTAIALVFAWITLLGLAGYASDVVVHFHPRADVGWAELEPVSRWVVPAAEVTFLVSAPCAVVGGIAWLGWLKFARDYALELRDPDRPSGVPEAG